MIQGLRIVVRIGTLDDPFDGVGTLLEKDRKSWPGYHQEHHLRGRLHMLGQRADLEVRGGATRAEIVHPPLKLRMTKILKLFGRQQQVVQKSYLRVEWMIRMSLLV